MNLSVNTNENEVEDRGAEPQKIQQMAIAATFTSEPIEDSLSFWLQKLNITSKIKLAPYNQIFQELLNPASLFARNQEGANVVLVRFEDWERDQKNLEVDLDISKQKHLLVNQSCYTLPNGLEIAHLHEYETKYLYQEIFIEQVYLKQGIILNDGDCVIDIGANIGLFTLFVQQKCPQASVYAFEPAHHVFRKLETNAKLYCPNATVFNCGLGAEDKEETFTFYPKSSVFSSFAADSQDDEKALRSIIINMLQRDNSLEEAALNTLADEFLSGRLEKNTYTAKLRNLSGIIEEKNIQQIDLLKLDAEKSELAILRGIAEDHWSRIKQIVMEVHDQGGSTLNEVTNILTAKGFEFVVDDVSFLQGSGLYNIYATRPEHKQKLAQSEAVKNVAQIEQNVQELGIALKTSTQRSSIPHLVCICPAAPTSDRIFYQRMEDLLASYLDGINNIYLVTSTELAAIYPVTDYYDPYGDEFGHIPYTPTFFSALGTMIARKIHAIKSNPYKVIVLDCDRTLWQGVCGEDGVTGVEIDPPRQALQEFIISQQQAGKLICLCSKNNEEDVFAVFSHYQNMPLQRHHLVSWRINWAAKSENIKSLASELQLGLDSFIFIDDNPVECMEVRANCPEVLTLQLPQDINHIPLFIKHIWAFDQLTVTKEDQKRTELYQQNVQRERLRHETLTFADFLAGLGLDIKINPMESEELPRVSQLTQRTNQFNFTTIRRSESEIQQLCEFGNLECRVVKVKDRFGDYGLVGLLLFTSDDQALRVDTFLLSCRVLGRGVEHRMLAYLGNMARERGLSRVELLYQTSKKNQPALDFVETVGREYKQELNDGLLFQFPVVMVADLTFKPNNQQTIITTTESQKPEVHFSALTASAGLFETIGNQLYTPELILKEILAKKQRQRPELATNFVAPRTPLEEFIARLFAEVLRLEKVGIYDNFFELGGDSIRGAILINKLQAQLNEIIHFVALFDSKTVAEFARYLEHDYPQAIAKILGQEITSTSIGPRERINSAKVLQLREIIPSLAPHIDHSGKNPPAIFVLSPPRSGSTLLRVILGGHPQLFAPPELELLSFNTLAERKAGFAERYGFRLEGTIRAIMEIKGCNPDEATALMADLESQNLTTKQCYYQIQKWLGDRRLVDKTPSYALDLEILKRAEIDFDNPLYIHLQRHPYGMLRSFEEARLEQIFFPYENSFSRQEVGELIWLVCQENILNFLHDIPPERQYTIKFEDLVKQPRNSVEGICEFLGIDFYPDMLQPYQEKQQRMTDPVYTHSKMLGDIKFNQYQGIEAQTADTWKKYYTIDFLGDITWQIAGELGYQRQENQPSHKAGEITKIERKTEDKFPLSFAQQRLWVLAQLEPESPFYNMFKAVRLNGSLNIAILQRSLNEIIRRQESLRTTFTMVDGTPMQVIAAKGTMELAVVDLQKLSETQQSEQLQQVATQQQLQPFDISQDLLLRVTVVQLGQESHVLLLTMHHIISDGWSLGVFIEELFRLYQGFLSGSISTLTELPIQYVDFTLWQRQWLQGELLQNQINYWKEELADAPPLLELPTDRPRPPVQTFKGRCFPCQIDEQLTEKLNLISQKSDVTLFMTLQAALAILLYRYSGEEDVLVGTPIANRNHQEIEPLIGFFVNTLVLRTRLAGNPSFAQLLQQVRAYSLKAYTNQDVPFEQVVEGLQLERNLSHTPLFQVVLALQNTPISQIEITGLTIDEMFLENVNAKFDIALQLWQVKTDKGTALEGFWQYNSDLFDRDRIARMTGHFQTLLAGIVANPEHLVGELPLLTEQERHQLLVTWNDTKRPYPDNKSIHELFEEQVEKTPDAVAVVYENESLTYGELNGQANQLAHYLQSLGVTTETLVGICVERSLLMIVGFLAILKAGGAYVPLDSDYPPERLAYMLQDAGVSVLLTQEKLVAHLPKTQARVVILDTDWQLISNYSQEKTISESEANHLAYVIYTSGSTGQPKGVAVTHQAVNRLVCNTDYVKLTPNHSIAQASNPAFDAATFEIWGALLNGGKLVGISKEVLLSPSELVIQLRQKQINVLFVTTALFNELVSQVPGIFQTLEILLFGGEAVDLSWVRTLLQQGPPRRLLHVYGPTESTTFSSWYLVQEVPETATNLPIGRPIANTRIYILNSHLQPVPIGVPGELCIAGDGLAKGYLNRPDLTEEKFIQHCLASSQRLYKTGDLVRYLPDGNIEFIGRIDNQVKIRGFRIELEEIAAVLKQHPQVRRVVVLAREDRPGIKRLAAYIVPEQPQPTANTLRQFLKEKLPDYMVPASFTILDALPITPNGKVDRRALPVPEIELDDANNYLSPRTPSEEILVQIWQDVLGLKQVGISDNFFALGGDSIIAIQIIARANQAGLKLTPKQLFGHQTIAELAAVAGTILTVQAEQGLVTGEIPLTPIQHWFFAQNSPEPHHFNQAVLLEVPAEIKPDLLQQAVQKLLYHHDALRLRFVQKNGNWQQINSDEWEIVPFQVIDLSDFPQAQQLKTIEEKANEQQRALHLAQGPLIQVVLFKLGKAASGRLLIVIHHLAVDGVSWRILLADLAEAYQQLNRGEPIQLPTKTTSFKDWAQRLTDYAKGQKIHSELNYWVPSFPSHVIVLPVNNQGITESNTVSSCGTISLSLSAQQTRLLLQEVPEVYNTQINDVLLTALVQSFQAWTGSPSLLIDLEGHGREDLFEDLDLSRTVGWFTSIFPVLLKLEGINHPGDALKSIKEQLRRIPQRGIGHGILRYLSPDINSRQQLQAMPQAQVSFNYLGQFDQTELAGLGWKYAQESSGDIHSPRGQRHHLLSVNGLVVDGRLQMEWKYSHNIHQQSAIEGLTNAYINALDVLISHCLSSEAGGYTPSDFEVEMNQAELDELLAELE
ncbi:amino acid adenylation domain-containing protein [Symplocastrum sp. BBK-W-15]|uniref:Amino acid adenylation domain-containing protein n=2 Tax=Limnofasciculus TaxID=3064905 RepID=A0AAE3KKZ8_9CYAN|nr:amino acid adenylation domain-containing protein [Limnofasciculus baicalensis BBK-W-15]